MGLTQRYNIEGRAEAVMLRTESRSIWNLEYRALSPVKRKEQIK